MKSMLRTPYVSIKNLSKKFIRDKRLEKKYRIKECIRKLVNKPTDKAILNPSEFWALKDITFDAFPGDIIRLVGTNGSGKTTLLRLIAGLVQPTSGEISKVSAAWYLNGSLSMFDTKLSIKENIILKGLVHGYSKKYSISRIDSIVEFAQIEHLCETSITNLSTGQIARLSFAIMQAFAPPVILLDEVFSVLDTEFSTLCVQKLEELCKNSCIVYVCHNKKYIEFKNIREIQMHKGRIVLNPDYSTK